jgi:hypothetical protein
MSRSSTVPSLRCHVVLRNGSSVLLPANWWQNPRLFASCNGLRFAWSHRRIDLVKSYLSSNPESELATRPSTYLCLFSLWICFNHAHLRDCICIGHISSMYYACSCCVQSVWPRLANTPWWYPSNNCFPSLSKWNMTKLSQRSTRFSPRDCLRLNGEPYEGSEFGDFQCGGTFTERTWNRGSPKFVPASEAFPVPCASCSTRVCVDLLDWICWMWCSSIWDTTRFDDFDSTIAHFSHLTTLWFFHSPA